MLRIWTVKKTKACYQWRFRGYYPNGARQWGRSTIKLTRLHFGEWGKQRRKIFDCFGLYLVNKNITNSSPTLKVPTRSRPCTIYILSILLLLLIFKWSCDALYCQKGGTCYSRGAPVAEGTECGFRKVKILTQVGAGLSAYSGCAPVCICTNGQPACAQSSVPT